MVALNVIDKDIISHYIEIVNYGLQGEQVSRQHLLEPSDKMLDELYDEFLGSIWQTSTFACMVVLSEVDKELKEPEDFDDFNEQVRKKEKEFAAEAIKEATLYMMFEYKDDYEEIINYILHTPMNQLTEGFLEKEPFFKTIFEMYIRYLVESHFSVITVRDEEMLEDKYPWLERLEENRGFMTINDKARFALRKVVETYVNMAVSQEKIVDLIDDYFNDYSSLGLGETFGREFGSNCEDIQSFKKYQLGLMVTDVYRSLKGNHLIDKRYGDTDSESYETDSFFELLENYLEYGDVDVLSSRDFRYELYKQFYLISLCDFIVGDLNEELENDSRTYIIKPLNPIYFLD